MHKSLSVTDGVYGVLSDLDVREQQQGWGNRQIVKMICLTR
jgi:hypothetical protein